MSTYKLWIIANVEVVQTVQISDTLQFMWHYVDIVERGVTFLAHPVIMLATVAVQLLSCMVIRRSGLMQAFGAEIPEWLSVPAREVMRQCLKMKFLMDKWRTKRTSLFYSLVLRRWPVRINDSLPLRYSNHVTSS